MRIALLVFALVVVSPHAVWAASPCKRVDISISPERKAELEPEIARQLGVGEVEVLGSFRLDGWSIIFAQPPASDPPYLFYSRDPLTSRYITLWSGAAAYFEEQSIRRWVLKNAPGIPPTLASCFAWHVTKDRN